ncbi:hypothetical protein [Paenibacillus humicola]|uniref:hypothetical protein n=1 Tax=Paenibacillus humicola TaxID=3110540 RepID=UPI00237BDF79|nr:hypothetical protein [Paenibacillus humicola]
MKKLIEAVMQRAAILTIVVALLLAWGAVAAVKKRRKGQQVRKLLFNLFISAFGILLYVLMIYGHESIVVKILITEFGSFALGYSGISMLNSMKNEDKNDK